MRLRSVAIVLRGRSVLLVRRSRDDTEYYTLPGGGVEYGETPLQACVRELKEETGLDAKTCARVCVFENRGREEYQFLVTEFTGVLELGGPERAACGPDNIYELVWMELEDLRRVDLKPERLLETISSLGRTLR